MAFLILFLVRRRTPSAASIQRIVLQQSRTWDLEDKLAAIEKKREKRKLKKIEQEKEAIVMTTCKRKQDESLAVATAASEGR